MRATILIPENIKLIPFKNFLKFEGSFGSIQVEILKGIKLERQNNRLILFDTNTNKINKSYFGLLLSLIKNHIYGVSKKFFKTLKIAGSGYKFIISENKIFVHAGKTKITNFFIPQEISIELIDSTRINICGINKHLVGEFAAKIRNIRPIEPYKFRGISYLDEIILKKEGKKRK